MNEHIKAQIIKDNEGNPEFAVIPYQSYLNIIGKSKNEETTVPSEVAENFAIKEYSLMKSWRLYKKITQKDMAEKMGISQPAYQQIENSESPHFDSKVKAAKALGILVEQLD